MMVAGGKNPGIIGRFCILTDFRKLIFCGPCGPCFYKVVCSLKILNVGGGAFIMFVFISERGGKGGSKKA